MTFYTKLFFSVLLIVALAVLWISYPIAQEISDVMLSSRSKSTPTPVQQPQTIAPDLVKTKTFLERQNWKADVFFETKESIRAASAIEKKEQEVLALLIKSGLDVNVQGKSGMTLLHWAYASNNLDAFQLLLDSGASPDIQLTGSLSVKWVQDFQTQDSVLFTIARSAPIGNDDMKFFDAALEKTANIELKDARGCTLLLLCADPTKSNFCHEDVMAKIVRRGADRNAKTPSGYTAAMIAASMGYPVVAVRLLEEGADPSVVDSSGHSVVTMLRRASNLKTNPNLKYFSDTDLARILRWTQDPEKSSK